MVLKVFRLLFVLVFAGYNAAAPLFVICHAPGPYGHDRLEMVQDCARQACSDPAPGLPHGASPCPADPGCCGDCRDEALDQPGVPHPAPLALACLVVACSTLPPFQILEPGRPSAPDPSAGPPLFLAHCTLRI